VVTASRVTTQHLFGVLEVPQRSRGTGACLRLAKMRIWASNIGSMSGAIRNADSKIHSPRFDCCAFLFYSFVAVTFAKISANRRHKQCSTSKSIRMLVEPALHGFDKVLERSARRLLFMAARHLHWLLLSRLL
jgi:hypothetical protein